MSKSGQDSGESTTFHSGPHVMPALEGDEVVLPVIDLSSQSPSAEFEMGALLGKGGMGQGQTFAGAPSPVGRGSR